VTLARAAESAGAGGVVVAAPPRGTARDPESGKLVGGRVYGPWLKAQALRAVGQVAGIVSVPVIGCGGVHSPDDARDFIEAGAVAVQVDTATWTQPRLLEIIARNLGGLELTRATGALADEWQPGMGETMLGVRRTAAPDEADQPPALPESPPESLPE
jgi:dihydroorotate dehydrogenase